MNVVYVYCIFRFLALLSLCITQSLTSSCSLVGEQYISSTGRDGVCTRAARIFCQCVIVVDSVTVAYAHVCWRRPPAHSYVISCWAVSYWADVMAI